MRETPWIDWTRTRLQPQEGEDLLTALTSEQKAHLLKHDYVWVEGVGVLWKPADGALRRARFTHGPSGLPPGEEAATRNAMKRIHGQGARREARSHVAR